MFSLLQDLLQAIDFGRQQSIRRQRSSCYWPNSFRQPLSSSHMQLQAHPGQLPTLHKHNRLAKCEHCTHPSKLPFQCLSVNRSYSEAGEIARCARLGPLDGTVICTCPYAIYIDTYIYVYINIYLYIYIPISAYVYIYI